MPTTSLKQTLSPVSKLCLVFSIHVTTPESALRGRGKGWSLYQLLHRSYQLCVYSVTLVMLAIKHSIGSSPLSSETVNLDPKSQKAEENTPLTLQLMN